MNSSTTDRFREDLARLPEPIRQQAARAFALWRSDPGHPSLSFKRVSSREPLYSVRVGIGYRALGLRDGEQIYWFWIGSHAGYERLLRRR